MSEMFWTKDEETQRQWLLYALFGVPPEACEWMMRQGFETPDDWIGDEAYRKRIGIKPITEPARTEWTKFKAEHEDTPRSVLETALKHRHQEMRGNE